MTVQFRCYTRAQYRTFGTCYVFQGVVLDYEANPMHQAVGLWHSLETGANVESVSRQ
jgi:hypothetical protein